jgi:hypothetical protein
MMRNLSCSLLALLIFVSAIASDAVAQDKSKTDLAKSVVGTWRIVRYTALDLVTKEVSYPQGKHPIGFLQYSPGGHLVVFQSSGEISKAKPPFSDADKVAFYNGLVAYCGTYTVQGTTVTHHVVAAYRPDWVGGDQVRHVELQGNRLTIKTAPIILAATGKRVVATLTWERAE